MSDLLDFLTGETQIFGVGELTSQIRDLLEAEFFDIWVEGEVSNFKRYSSGHWYFTLKDEHAQVRCAAFRNHNIYIRFRPEDGLKVRARGRISVYEPRGEYQLLVNSIEPVGKGALQLAFEQLKARLFADGLFEIDRKRPLPTFPRRIGVITSPQGAVIHDILNILGRRNRSVDVLIHPVRVQGETAAAEIVEAISNLNERSDIDVIVLARGGGSIEDLWPFNEERVARAIYSSRVPVVSAIGHETDFTIADFVADFRAPTPSAAAEIIAPHTDELKSQIEGCLESLASAFQYFLLQKQTQLAELLSSRAFDAVPSMLRNYNQQLDYLGNRLETSADKRLERMGDRLRLGAGKLHALSPLAVLSRGYAVVRDADGNVVKRAFDVAPGETINVTLAEGEMTCTKIS